jgi:DNA-binding XRE family transcriptional regulator
MAITGIDIHMARRKHGVRQQDIARRLGVFRHTLVDLEAGRIELSPDCAMTVLQAINDLTSAKADDAAERAA